MTRSRTHPKAFHLNESQRMPRDFDLAFVAMKVYDTAWAAQLALRHLKPEGYIVASENCWPDPIVASVAGASRSLGLVMSKIGVALWKPGQVERGAEKGQGTGHDVFRVGEHDGKVTARANEVAEMLKVIDGSQVTEKPLGRAAGPSSARTRWATPCRPCRGSARPRSPRAK
jgi:2-dehydropantoate 2-reductase